MAVTEKQLIASKKYRIKHKQKILDYSHKYYNDNKELIYNYDYYFKKNLAFNYGMTVEDYYEMFAKQKGCCAICGRHQSEFKRALSVDHNHETGEIRGLLCDNCNLMLGKAKESIEILKSVIKYLKKHRYGSKSN